MTFENVKPATSHAHHQQQQQPVQRLVHVSQVVTEVDLVTRSNQLESALVNNQLSEFCVMKIGNSKSVLEESVWNFLQVRASCKSRCVLEESVWNFLQVRASCRCIKIAFSCANCTRATSVLQFNVRVIPNSA